MMKNKELSIIKSLVGDTISKEHLALVDSYVNENLSVFMPVGGNCGYAVSPSHTHPSYMFVLSYDSETEFYVDDKKFQSIANSVFCLSPHVEHHEAQNYLPPKYSAVFIDKEFFEENLKLYTKELENINKLVVGADVSKLDRLLKEFIHESLNSHPSSKIVIQNIVSLLTHELIRIVLDSNTDLVDVSDNQAINEVVKYINTNYEKNITIEELSKISKLSKSHFTKVFTQNIKMSPMEYLKHIRLQNAKKMVLSNKLSITTISSQCGFNSSAYFSKLFKEAFGETPKEFASRHVR